ncbi:MAG: HEPN domain-containing protein [Candidatus Odinarchaeota archaeon]|nr:HEPN domain-containing protein [Candidatus Odinarchaeota archaeon]
MKFIKLAKSYLRQARARVNDAEDAYNEGNYPYAVRLSQEAVELSLKASLRLVGIEYPKIHDVSDILIISKNRFPEWFRREIPFLAETSKKLVKKREISFYGGEEGFLSPEDLISKEDAEDAVKRAKKVTRLCQKLLEQYGK